MNEFKKVLTAATTLGAGCFTIIGFIAVIMIAASIINGFVIKTLWGWFIVPFFGVGQLSIPLAIGFGLIMSYITYHWKSSPKEKDESLWTGPVGALLYRPMVTLLIGWVAQRFV